MVYVRRLLRHQVPAVVTASCVAWYGHWRTGNGLPSMTVAEELQQLVEVWITRPRQRSECEAAILAAAHQLAGNDLAALEDFAV